MRENQLKFDMLLLFRTNLPKKGDRVKNLGHVSMEDKIEIVCSSKFCLNLLLWIWDIIVTALKFTLWLVLDECRKSMLLGLPNLISYLCSYRCF